MEPATPFFGTVLRSDHNFPDSPLNFWRRVLSVIPRT
jgi:hypothetical protein